MKRSFALLLAILVLISLVSCGEILKQPVETADTPSESVGGDESDESTEKGTTVKTAEETKKTRTMTLRIGSYNIANGREVDHDMQKLADDIISQRLDIVGLQEVDRFAKRSKFIDTVKVLSEMTGLEYFSYTKAIGIAGDSATYGTAGQYGTAILSRYPIKRAKSMKLESGLYEQRMLGSAEIDVDGVLINFFNTHLSYEDEGVRRTQFMALDDAISGVENCFVTGDFNVSSLSEFAYVNSLSRVCTLRNPLATIKSGKCIDNILFSKNITLGDFGVVKSGHSDHYMLYGEFTLTVEE